MSRVETDIILD